MLTSEHTARKIGQKARKVRNAVGWTVIVTEAE